MGDGLREVQVMGRGLERFQLPEVMGLEVMGLEVQVQLSEVMGFRGSLPEVMGLERFSYHR